MKKLITCLLLFCLVSVGVNAQTALTTATYGNARDTVTNTATKTWKSVLKGFSLVGLQFDVTKISGTIAGNVIPVGSIDGVTYYDISIDTLKLADVTSQGKIWSLPNTAFTYYGLRWTGSGTMSASGIGKVVGRKLD